MENKFCPFLKKPCIGERCKLSIDIGIGLTLRQCSIVITALVLEDAEEDKQ